MDGWRVVTGILTILFLCGSVFLLAEADAVHQEAEECVRTDGWFCWDFSGPMRVVAVWFLVLGSCFGGATLVRAWVTRRRLVIAGVCLLVLPVVALWLFLASPIGFVVVVVAAVLVSAWLRAGNRHSADESGKGAGDH